MLRENKHTKSHEKASEGACKTGSQCAYLKGALTEIYLEVVEGVLCLEAQALQWVGEEVLAGEAVVEVAGLEAEVRVRLVYWVGVAVALLVPVSWI